MANKSLNKAKGTKNDEFYTQYNDIVEELSHYTNHFENKTIFCNCDDPKYSKFYQYFESNFDLLKLKKLITTHYNKDNTLSYALIYEKDFNGSFITQRVELKENGDFRSNESIFFLKQSDIVITNPPFSLFREYISQLMEHNKKFLIIGNLNAIKYKEVFPFIKENKLWLGYNFVKKFEKPNGDIQVFGNICWYTNLDIQKRYKELTLTSRYNSSIYKKYDNYDAINVDKVKNIPFDYDGVMGVPISFISKYNPNQFEIIGELNHGCDSEYDFAKPIVDGKELFPRLLIKRKGVV